MYASSSIVDSSCNTSHGTYLARPKINFNLGSLISFLGWPPAELALLVGTPVNLEEDQDIPP